MDRMSNKSFHGFITVVGLIFFVPFLGGVHLFDWDEINFAESAREMLVTGNYRQVMVNFEPFWEKPPLFFWLQALCMRIFGVNEFAARLPNAIVGIISLHTIFHYGRRILNTTTAKWWVFLYLASITPHFYFHSGIIDPLFNLFIFAAIIQIYFTLSSRKWKHWLLAGTWLGLAVLTKGPAAGLIVLLFLFVLWVRNKAKFWFSLKDLLVFASSTLLIASIWFVPEVVKYGTGFLSNFLAYQLDLMKNPVASHGQPWFYHAVVLLIGCFPASILALRRFVTGSDDHSFELTLKVMFWVVLILFSLVTTKIVHYSSLCYFPLTGLAAIRLSRWSAGDMLIHWEKVLLSVFTVLWSILFIGVPLFGYTIKYWLTKYPNLIRDEFTLQNFSVAANWSTWHIIIGVFGAVVLFGLLGTLIQNKRLIATNWLMVLGVYLVGFLGFIVPQIERHTQGSIITFYESIEDEDCYVDVYKFKSYAHYFYTEIEPLSAGDGLLSERITSLLKLGATSRLDLNEEQRKVYTNNEMQWLLTGEIDKPVYLIAQPRKAKELANTPGFELIQNTGGYWVFKRMPDSRIE